MTSFFNEILIKIKLSQIMDFELLWILYTWLDIAQYLSIRGLLKNSGSNTILNITLEVTSCVLYVKTSLVLDDFMTNFIEQQ